jgi:hypothetical protein
MKLYYNVIQEIYPDDNYVFHFLDKEADEIERMRYIRYTPERMSKYDARLNGEICLGKVSIVIKLIG